MEEYLHPSISSRIIDDSVIFVTAAGSTVMLTAFTSDIGPDNTLVRLTTPSEAEFHYGKPNMRRHGQAMYNIRNFLQSGGEVFGLRVMPENAGFAHVILDVQTKMESGKLQVRPVLMYSPVNHTSHEALEAELKRVHSDTVDGYKHHLLGAFRPKGRGKGYNDLGVQLRLTTDLDNTNDFRVYEASVVRVSKTGTVTPVEGPFLVSFSPDAKSKSNEKMTIDYVFENFSEQMEFLYNEDAYNALGAAINPDVDPALLDLLTVTERDVDGEDPIHAGTKLADVSSSTVAAIVNADEAVRVSDHAAALTAIATIEDAMDKVEAGTYNTEATALKTALTTSKGDPTTAGTFLKLKADMVAAVGEAAEKLAAEALLAYASGAKRTEQLQAYNLGRAVQGATVAVLAALVAIEGYTTASRTANVVEMATLGLTSRVTASQAAITAANVGADPVTRHQAAKDAVALAKEVRTTVLAISTEADATETTLDTAITAADAALAAYAIATTSSAANKLNTATSAAAAALTAAQAAINTNLTEAKVDAANDVITSMETAYGHLDTVLTAAVGVAKASDADKVAVLTAAAGVLTEARSEATVKLGNTYGVDIYNIDNLAPLGSGTDGDLDESNPTLRTTTATSLLVSAYSGTLDQNVTNKKLVPIDLTIDANYPTPVKTAMLELARNIRGDHMAILDTGFTPNAAKAVDFRKNQAQASSFFGSLYTQDFVVEDAEFTGGDIKVTMTYFLSRMIPANDTANGIQFPLAGLRRGVLDGFKRMSFNPTETWKEELYKLQINYAEQDNTTTKIGSQLTMQKVVSALSDQNNVRVLLRILRRIERMGENYQFEFSDASTYNAFQADVNGELSQWVDNRACKVANGTVYASDYEKKRKVTRVKTELVFNNVIERVVNDIIVK
jgi:hypothetical protein